jgi:hypothetical protein
MLKLPKITNKQTALFHYLYKFYFLNTNQFQKLLNHKQPQTVQKWLKDLNDKKIIGRNYSNKLGDNTMMAIYYRCFV